MTDMAQATLLQLAPEVLLEILSHLDCVSLLRCCETCQHLRNLIENSGQLQYHIALYRASYERSADPRALARTGIAPILEHLRSHINRWNRLDWSESHFPIPSIRGNWDFASGVLTISTGPNSLWTCQLPSLSRNDQCRSKVLWTEFPVEAFTTDPNADLIVYFELHRYDGVDYSAPGSDHPYRGRLHIRSLESNSLNSYSTISLLETAFPVFRAQYQLRIFGDKLGLLCQHGAGSWLTIWSWRSGMIEAHAALDAPMASFCFVTPSTLLTACYLPWDDGAQEYQVGLRLCGIHSNTRGLRPMATFLLPQLHADILSGIVIQPSRSPDMRSKPFFPSSRSSLIQILWTTEGEASSDSDDSSSSGPIARNFDIFMHSGTLLHLAYEYAGHAMPIPWHHWGPMSTRLQANANNALSLRQKRFFSGNRFVRRYRNMPSIISVLDFSPGRWTWDDNLGRRRSSEGLVQGGSQIIVDRSSPTVISCPELFQDDTVMSSLPYSRVHRDVGFPLRGDLEDVIICDDERIILIESFAGASSGRLVLLSM
ncbi:uncharacterized protein EI90DRAFT_3069429 [Cantharellus anzutake]|uniref:uncharacterized protein n=1 Tax=Cantharellus anzutake TaxID=1750568 RepID=UPI001906BEF0|nr:uncharacterized protein EI90DRAFT_3069429 [Cantharellus anzutake]KAF8326885.1 hypothetical protein EI90DRAFT_3069429 [Cantharellus anzutake]